jgi:hypothetical protein
MNEICGVKRMILFLDFDGVLHPDAVFLEKRRPVLHADGELFMWVTHLIKALEPHPEVQIVLSTSWVRIRGFTRAKKVLPKAIQDRVIGGTWHSAMGRSEYSGHRLPVSWWDQATRYQQIAGYVARAKLTHWVAIDDNCEGWPDELADRLIRTDPNRGISDPAALTKLHARLNSV